jgi:hypothetical protein
MLICSTAAAQQPQPTTAPASSYDAALSRAQPPMGEVADDEESWNLGLKAGLLASGSVYVEIADRSFDTSAGPLLLLSADAVVAKRFSLGVFLLNAHPSVTVLGTDYDTSITTMGTTLKGRFGPSGGVSIRPGMAFGYQRLSSDATSADDVQGLDLGVLVEVSIPTGSVRIPLEFGIISQPVGGNDDTEITFAPIFYLAGGVEFGG